MRSTTCFVTIIFPNNRAYFVDFIKSINAQTYQDFQLLIFNDDVENINDFIDFLEVEFTIIEIPKHLSIAENRTFTLQYLKDSHFEYAIFGDSDDYFPPNRVETNLYYLSDYDVVINDTHLVDINKSSLVPQYFQLENKMEIKFNAIKNKNCCGLGNTAIQIKSLPDNIEFNSNIAAIDWMLFSRMLIEGRLAIYTNDSFIYYRQHDLNLIGLKSITKERLFQGISIKLNHYSNIKDEYNLCNKEFLEFHVLSQYCRVEENLNLYLKKILSLNLQNPMWWEEIKTLKELNIEE